MQDSDSLADPNELMSDSNEDVLDYVSALSCGDLSDSSTESDSDGERSDENV